MTRMSEPLDLTAWMTRWRMLPPPGGLILCAVSGGRDSVCLLDCLWKLGRARDFRVAAAHLNHGMRPTAQRDEDLVRALCAERNIPFYTETVDVYALCAVWRLTVEETGRRARYDFLRRTADALAADFIATAHHRDDQAETVLLQLLRGTGPQGLTGIPPVRDGIIRPLLDTPRAAIDDYIAQNRLPYVTDETNLDTHYARNRLRLDIMPQLLAINPAAAAHIARTADILRAENDLLDAQAAAIIDGVPAAPQDFETEYLDYKLSVAVVDDVDAAIAHIAKHSTHHSEAIVTADAAAAQRFTTCVDSAAVYVNASTRFTDGGEFGLGCEMGISTQKLHARGPMGLAELCTYKYIVHGNGQVRGGSSAKMSCYTNK